jgi:hypothetical protein
VSPLPPNLEPLLAGYIDGVLSKEELAQVETYLDAHPDLREELQRMMLDSEYLRMLPQARLPEDVSDGVGSQMEREMLLSDAGAPTRAAQQRFGLPGLAVAAMVLMGIGIGVVAMQILGAERSQMPQLVVREAPGSKDTEAPVPTTTTADRAAVVADMDRGLMAARRDVPPAPVTPAPAIAAEVASLPDGVVDEVIGRIDVASLRDRPVVMVVESGDIDTDDLRVRTFFATNGYAYSASTSTMSPEAVARSSQPGPASAMDPDRAGDIRSNVAEPNAIGNAIAIKRAAREPTVLVARGVELKTVEALQSELDAGSRGLLPDGLMQAGHARSYNPPALQRTAVYRTDAAHLQVKQMAQAPMFAMQAPASGGASAKPADASPRLVQPGDVLSVSVLDPMSQVKLPAGVSVTVDRDGFLDLPGRGVFQVRGLTPDQVAAAILGDTESQRAAKAAADDQFATSVTVRFADDTPKPAAPLSDAPPTTPTTAPAVDRVDLIVVVRPALAEPPAEAATTAPTTMPTTSPDR